MSYRKAIAVEGLPPGWSAHYERSTNLNAETEHEVTAIHAVHGRVSVWGGGKKQDTDAALLAAVRKKMPRITAIFLDVDEVLVDWVSDALAVLGYDPATVAQAWAAQDPRPWDLCQVVGVTPTALWACIDAHGAEFWARLQPFPWMHTLLGLCREHAPTTLLTSPAPLPACHAGKAQWMQNTFGRDFRDYALTSVKHRFAHPGALLIDDSPRNCAAFQEHGGHAILFPGVGNDLHDVPGSERVAYVREQLKGYQYATQNS